MGEEIFQGRFVTLGGQGGIKSLGFRFVIRNTDRVVPIHYKQMSNS